MGCLSSSDEAQLARTRADRGIDHMRQRLTKRSAIGVGLCLAITLGALWVVRAGDSSDPTSGPGRGDDGPFVLRLSAGQPAGAPEDPAPLVAGDELDDDAVAEITDRLPTFVGAEGDRVDFERPPDARPRPRVGETVDRPFGVGGDGPPPATPSGPLEVVRHQPDGDVDTAPFISMTFNHPMVPLGTLEQLDQADVPVTVTPDLEGRWRWIGTRTLRFEHAGGAIDRLPAATKYTVEIPAGTTSDTGAPLGDAVTWTFSTPPPRVESLTPDAKVIDRDPVFVVTFDQRVDPQAVLDTISLTAGESRSLRLASDEEVAADNAARERTEEALDGRWVAFTPTSELPADTAVTIEIGPDTPSAEGPLVSEDAATHRTRTYAPLRVRSQECGADGPCRPDRELAIIFNNPLDLDSFDADLIEVSPPMGAAIGVHENRLSIQGSMVANTTYVVTLPGSLEDSFGQTLGDAEPVTFEVGDATPVLEAFPTRLITTDPFADSPSVSVTSSGQETLAVTIYSVTPADYGAYADFLDDYADFLDDWDTETLEGLPGQELSSTTVEVAGEPGQTAETTIDLGDALGGGLGHLIVVVSPTRVFPEQSEDYWSNRPTLAWVQSTSMAVDALTDTDHLLAWATDLKDGSALDRVVLRLEGSGAPVTTNADGLADVPLGTGRFLVAEHDGETALLAPDHQRWEPLPIGDVARWYVVDDRQLYRPGETARVKGWVRRLTLSNDAHIAPVGGAPTVKYVVNDSFGNELAVGTAALTGTGGFDLALDLPRSASLGPAVVRLELVGGDAIGSTEFQHVFQIEEFRRPEFEVLTSAETAEPHLLTQPLTVAAVARYFAGGTLPDAAVTWQVTNRPTTYSPPNWSDFTFGVWRSPWIEDLGDNSSREQSFGPVDFSEGLCCEDPNVERLTYAGRTDATGTHFLQLDFEGQKPDEPITVSANAAVTDVNRQSFGSTIDLLVHPASLYVGLASDRTFVRGGEAMDIEAIATDLDGEAVAGRELRITAARVTQELVNGEWTEVVVDPESCTVTSGDEPVSCSFAPEVGGQYRVTSVITDDDGGRNRSELTVWVSGADETPARTVDQETVTLVPDQEEHQPGDTAELLVIAPFTPAHGLLTVQRNGIEQTRTFAITEASTVLEIPITDALVPGIGVQVDLVGSTPRRHSDGTVDADLPPRPAFATGSLTMAIPAAARTLAVTATPAEDEIEPGATTTVDLTVVNAAGDPVAGAEVAVIVVDEAVLSLAGYELPDPIAQIYQPLASGLRADYARRTLLLADPETLGADPDLSVDHSSTTVGAFSETGAAIGGSSDGASQEQGAFAIRETADLSGAVSTVPAIDVRTNFDALAVFEPAVPTGADGTATVEVTLPDNLTRYRVMAVAADAVDRFGWAESTITARLPLQVRPSPPRFLNFGDQFELPVVVQNLSDDDLDVDVVVETANLSLGGAEGQRVTVPAQERVEVRFAIAAEDAGTARFRVSAVSGDLADSASGSLPVYTPTTTEAFATYGVVDDGAVGQPLLTPTGVVPTFGGLEIDTSSTALQALTDSVIYLTDYPYDSADAYASRIIALTALKDVFAAFATATAPTPAELDGTVRSDLEALAALQSDDGGFSPWQRGGPTQPYDTVQATHALIVADAAGFPVNRNTKDAALYYLADIEARFPAEWDEPARHAVSAYALHVRALAGQRDPAKAEALHRSDPELALDALAWLWPVVDDPAIDAAIERTFANRVTETPGAASFTTGFDESAAALVLASDRRTDGIILKALLTERPVSDLIPKIVTGLIGNQVKGRWNNVQENGFILLAMKHYFDTFEATTPAFVARAWLGDTYATEHAHQGRSVDGVHTLVPMTELAGDPDIVLSKDGAGRLYYRLGLRYAPDDLALDARDEGFVVDRTYEATGDADDVTRDADGTWHIKPGATVRVRLTLVADSQRTNMALVDPLPAGLEIVNPALSASPRIPPEEPTEDDDGPIPLTWFGSTWFDHQNLRDDRAEAYSSYLPAGTYEYTYIVRATTLGTFITPPTKAEEIYSPEVFGRTSTDVVVVG